MLFMLLGMFLVAFMVSSVRLLQLTRLAALVSIAVVIARLSEYLTGVELGVDGWLFAFPSERLGLAPVAKMAFFTAVTFLFLGCALLFATSINRQWVNDIVKIMSIIVSFLGMKCFLG